MATNVGKVKVCIELCERCKLSFYPDCENNLCRYNDAFGRCAFPEHVKIDQNGLCSGYSDSINIWE
jgi:hypothetical protein